MRKTAFDIIRQIGLEVESRKLPLEVMIRDIQMMRFKLRPVIGDIDMIGNMQYDFVRSLWKIGKIDEIISEALYEMSEDDQDAVIDYFSTIEENIQDAIRDSLTIKQKKNEKKQLLKIEIFKDLSSETYN